MNQMITDDPNKPPCGRLSSGSKRSYDDDSDPCEAAHLLPSTSTKRVKPTIERDKVLMYAFKDKLNDILANDIIHFIESSADLEAHKSEITSSTRLRKGTATQAQQRINAEPTKIEHLLRRKREERTPLQRGKDFVKKNFVNIVKEPRTNIKGKDKVTKRAPKAKNDNESVKTNKEKPKVRILLALR
ncbi:uncharacterized protein EV154DRAFT_574768 [Mucor mucedo]|uniref:uncharacterized protein n=1 Tax=Mucor mucedo TaxID=29922 RepID=UPI00221F0152|nr:uncharacterized protein EV154DRAFT_574768 [Mucor mucedo]KAI7883809.1 hypothetical protein EV154DRAFT_574768 [Mucor mucedo]